MVQHVTAAVSIVGSLLLCLVFIGLVYDLITGYSARRRFAKLLSLKKVWHGGKSCATAAPPIGRRAYRTFITQSASGNGGFCRQNQFENPYWTGRTVQRRYRRGD
jgi:hypothetical protein